MDSQLECCSKSTAGIIAYGITLLFNKSRQIPKAWKMSSVLPVPKAFEVTSVSNHRPISLLPVVSKLLEKAHTLPPSCHIKDFLPNCISP